MGVQKAPVVDRRIARMDDGVGARKRVFIPGYSGVISRINETIAGTFAQNSRDSHYLVYKGCTPTMEAASLPSPDTFYSRHRPRTPSAPVSTVLTSAGLSRATHPRTHSILRHTPPAPHPTPHSVGRAVR